MTRGFDITFDSLPGEIPLFPLSRVILLPRTQLPLNIFEPRYLAMIDAAMKSDRLVGIAQATAGAGGAETFRTGGAGRIVSFSETEDGRYLVTLKGVCRFDVAEELPLSPGGFRRIRPDWSRYAGDFSSDTVTDICRDSMTETLRAYFNKIGLSCDQWEQMRNIGCEKLISTLSVICPFGTQEKQALLEAPDLPSRARLLKGLMENALRETAEDPCRPVQPAKTCDDDDTSSGDDDPCQTCH